MLRRSFRHGLAAAIVIAASCNAPAFAATTFTVGANVSTIATIDISTNAFTFTSTDNTNAHLAANENVSIPAAGNITGSIRTTKANPGYINIVAPAGPLTGAASATIPVSALQITCAAGSGNSGLNAATSGLAIQAALVASSSTQCAKYNNAATGTSAQVGILLSMFLDDTAVIADTYSALSGFSVSASAT
ncbi:MAG: hypothetical protein GIW95_10015 [Candidatus Eremiobacteraeota bacterium]|nr:hypothetical protein [Candidatus Eremiobacteraeota bacterium]